MKDLNKIIMLAAGWLFCDDEDVDYSFPPACWLLPAIINLPQVRKT
jgi:hypothetical protein